MRWSYLKGISLIAVSGRVGYRYSGDEDRVARTRNCEYILSMMNDGKREPKRLITHRFHYTEMVEAYDMALRREKSMLGVIFEW